MAEAARILDTLDVRPAFTAADVAELNARFIGMPTADMLRTLLTGELHGRVALVSSFGAESAVLLHLVSEIDRDVPLVFTNTQKMFGETLAYRDELAERLGFTDLRVFRPNPRLLAEKDKTGLRWSYDPDGCCAIRKVEPLQRALVPFDAWISGRKGFQAGTRNALPIFELDREHPSGPKLKLNPLAGWSKDALNAYFEAHDLPRHPLEAEGYLSIGCSPCTSKVKPGEDPRAGRWRGWDKVECGMHSAVPQAPQENDPIF
ncbi:phosphoadenylyl-sulfate reductase [Sphingomonas nostoxanthinifaciens]|uniref:phosphoadenylyl-sulfate reductase n=1 Tax=Sphingomonas nostoxanthinifaciens TaxID=2872652 RepID=UPI001CC1F55F|nr:phosphoadenylyl-sulfate reductase [Sphingomonas nostoxanthinifaciens]UAK26189.1 phosphoadenylyl-sulfate reductase [Sphingomonas nostoxanthinifaciens]